MNRFLLFCFLWICLQARSQRPVGSWQVHLPYFSFTDIQGTQNKLYSSTNFSVIEFNTQSQTITKLDKAASYSDVGVSAIGLDEKLGAFIIGYQNGNIDITLKNGDIVNLPDIQNSTQTGEKRINHILSINGLSYISTSFGIVVVDLKEEVIKETYIIGDGGSNLSINSTAILENMIFAATDQGVKLADLSSPNLSDFNNWVWVDTPLPRKKATDIVTYNNALWVSIEQTSLYKGTPLNWEQIWADSSGRIQKLKISNDLLYFPIWKVSSSGEYISSRFARINKSQIFDTFHVQNSFQPTAIWNQNQQQWMSSNRGLFMIQNSLAKPIFINAPASNRVSDLQADNEKMYLATGGHTSTYEPLFNIDGFFTYDVFGDWKITSRFNENTLIHVTDLLEIDIAQSGEVAFASLRSGVLLKKDKQLEVLNHQNSILTVNPFDEVRITDIGYDSQENLWIIDNSNTAPLVVKKKDGKWLRIDHLTRNTTWTNIIVDSRDLKWIIQRGRGILLYHEGEDLNTPSDDISFFIRPGEGSGNLPTSDVKCIAEDLEGNIWVGTSNGIAIFFCASDFKNNRFCDGLLPTKNLDGIGAHLFSGESVNAIAVDGANRKWIGTDNGVWLVDENGQKEISRFTVENSPLLSNEIQRIGIMPQTGEVFFGTSKGVVSFLGKATQGRNKHQDVKIFPNPVPSDYQGLISIRGLAQSSFFKLTDVSGNLIYEGNVLGGQATWDGKDYTGRKAKTGVYFILVSGGDKGKERFIGKLMFFN